MSRWNFLKHCFDPAMMTGTGEIRNQAMKRTSTYLPLTHICLALICCLVSTNWLTGQDDLFAVPGTDNLKAQVPSPQDPPVLPSGLPNFQAPDSNLSIMDPYIPEQKNEVNERFAGWRQAGTGKNIERLDEGLRANWIMSDSNGRIDGTIATYGDSNLLNMRVSLLNRGRVVSQTNADAFGRFRFNNVRPGTYTLAGFGDSAMFVFGFNVLAFSEEAADRIPRSIDVLAVPNQTTINLDCSSSNIRSFIRGKKCCQLSHFRRFSQTIRWY